jgi:hypothetical protein
VLGCALADLQIGWRGMVFIVDDNFIGNERNVKQLLPALADWSERHGHPFSFLTEAMAKIGTICDNSFQPCSILDGKLPKVSPVWSLGTVVAGQDGTFIIVY